MPNINDYHAYKSTTEGGGSSGSGGGGGVGCCGSMFVWAGVIVCALWLVGKIVL